MTQTNTRKGDNQMTQLRAEQIAADHYCDYDDVEFYADGRKWIVRGHRATHGNGTWFDVRVGNGRSQPVTRNEYQAGRTPTRRVKVSGRLSLTGEFAAYPIHEIRESE